MAKDFAFSASAPRPSITPQQLHDQNWVEHDKLPKDSKELFVWTGDRADKAKRTLSAHEGPDGQHYVTVNKPDGSVSQVWRVKRSWEPRS